MVFTLIKNMWSYLRTNDDDLENEKNANLHNNHGQTRSRLLDLQDLILTNGQTVPVVTKNILESKVDHVLYHQRSEELGTIAEVLIDGVRTIISNEPDLADQVFRSKVFIERSANDEGLEHLGMKNRGLIWNNDNHSWRIIRKVFQTSLREKDLQYAREIAAREVTKIVDKYIEKSPMKELNFLEIFRKVTFHVTMELFCNVTYDDLIEYRINEDEVIASIVNYFKAWEYFLFRPNSKLDHKLAEKHQNSVQLLNKHVNELIQCALKKCEHEIREQKTMFDKFVDLDLEPEMMSQTFLEMLLAGTDTSSVTMYYAMLGLSGRDDISVQFQRQLHKNEEVNDMKFDYLVDQLSLESLRFKPVGPVIIRQACDDVTLDTLLQDGSKLQVKKGEGMIINVESMNYLSGIWDNPHLFNPARGDLETNKGKFFPFGEGPKGCVGKYLGLAEVRAALKALIPQFRFDVVGEVSLQTLETHWDIANQPDNPPLIRCIPRQ